MKKLLKKMSAFLLTAAMVTGMCMTSFAASEAKGEWGKVTSESTANLIVGVSSSDDTSANGGDNLLAYKVVDIRYDESSNNLTYHFTQLFQAFQAQEGNSWNSLNPKDYGNIEDGELKELLGAFTSYIRNQEPKPEADYKATADTDGIADFGRVAMGQYIIVGDGTSTGAKIYQTVTAEIEPEINGNEYQLNGAYTVAMKTSKPSIGKTIKEGTVTDEKIETTAQPSGDKHDKHQQTSEIGKEITYELNISVPTYPEGSTNKTFYAGDILSKGLDLREDSIVVTGYHAGSEEGTVLAKDEVYTAAITVNNEEGTENRLNTSLYVDFDFDKIAGYDHVVIQYKAVLNQDAELGTTAGNPNNADLIYSNTPFEGSTWKPEDGERPGPGEGFGQDEDMEIVYTYALVIDKFEEKHEGEKLSDAVFELYRTYSEEAGQGVYSEPVVDEKGAIITLTTDENGAAAYKGLQQGTYYLKEIKAPTGYNLMDEPVIITIDASTIPYYIETEKEVTHYTYTINAGEALSGHEGQAEINGNLVWMNEAGVVMTTAPGEGAPDGFSAAYVKAETKTVTNVIEINRDAEGANGFYKAGVSNNQGAQLPSTGGMGTTIFTVVGLCLMVGAAIVLITRRRMTGRD